MAFWTGRWIRDAKQAANVTRNSRDAQFTIERLAHDCLDIRELRRRGFLTDRRVEIGPSIRWPKIARMTIERYRMQLNFWRQAVTTEPDTAAPLHSPSDAALRMRSHRERRRDGLRCMTIELRETEVTALIRKGFLKEDARSNLQAVRSAFYGFLDRTFNFVKAKPGSQSDAQQSRRPIHHREAGP